MTKPDQLKPLSLTMGEPAGVGPDITLAAYTSHKDVPAFVLIGSTALLRERAQQLSLNISIETVSTSAEVMDVFPRALPVLDTGLDCQATPGQLDPASAKTIISSIEMAVSLTQNGETSAVVTNPIHKKNLYDAGFDFPGHTEFLAKLAGSNGKTPKPVMMLACPVLKVVPVTIHIPVRDIPGMLTKDLIVETARITARDLKIRFGIPSPRLAVAGLNPHAGEDGGMGNEDIEIIKPAIQQMQNMGISAFGPLPADTMFHAEARERYDAALGMYHDQALIPIKTLDFHGGVNTTLGLPFIRTSPDHGTALDLAGSGKANPSSLIAALRMAAKCAEYESNRL